MGTSVNFGVPGQLAGYYFRASALLHLLPIYKKATRNASFCTSHTPSSLIDNAFASSQYKLNKLEIRISQ